MLPSLVFRNHGNRHQRARLGVWCPWELTTEHLIEASLRLDWSLGGSLGLQPISSLGNVEIWLKFHETWTLNVVFMESLLRVNLQKMLKFWLKIITFGQ